MVALFTFYRNFIVPSIAVSIIACIFVVQSGTPYSVLMIFWMKMIVSFFLGVLHYTFRPQSLFFYHNLGFSVRQLYGFALLADEFLWIAMTILTIFYFL